MTQESPKSIYVHIPFCVRKCLYCDFASYPGKESVFDDYVDALKTEIRRAGERFPGAGISTVYFGGGTPTILRPDQLSGILDEIRGAFTLDPDAEISTEANPGASGDDTGSLLPMFRHLRESGFNRLSLGVQSFHDSELRLLGRIHSADDAVRAFGEAREAGFDNISIDLMYGIPEQTFQSWQTTLDRSVELQPNHISLYSLTVEEGTPFHRMQVQGALSLPGDDAEADMYEEAIRALTAAGFEHYEISNFAMPGFRCRHNITYWQNESYFGFGAGAASYMDGVRAANISAVDEYINLVKQGESPRASDESLPSVESMGETVFLGLRMMDGVDIDSFILRYGVSPVDAFPGQIDDLLARRLIAVSGNHIKLTHHGLLFANDVFAEFIL
ncbi:MAG: radical SAM family heme chaperone HemW [Armatimonadota bacterium]